MVNNETRYGNVSEEYTGRNWAGGCTIGGSTERAKKNFTFCCMAQYWGAKPLSEKTPPRDLKCQFNQAKSS